MNKHNRVYTILLTLLTFGILWQIGLIIFFIGTEGIMRFFLYSEILMASLCVLTLILRFIAGEIGRILTKVLNVFLLLYFPLGTALAVYGFLKVEKRLTKTEEEELQHQREAIHVPPNYRSSLTCDVRVTTMNKHDKIYTGLLALITCLFLGFISLDIFAVGLGIRPGDEMRMLSLYSMGLLFLLCALTLILRLITSEAGRMMTRVVNIILLFFFPLGTPLAIYGFMKVDKQTRETNREDPNEQVQRTSRSAPPMT